MKAALISLVSVAFAHIQVLNPPARGSDELDSLTGPCGLNLNSPSSRSSANAGGFSIKVQVADADAKMVVNAGSGTNPGSFPINVASVSASLEVVDVGIDLSRIPGLKNGDPITLQVVETSLDGVKYACIDLTVIGLTESTDPKPSEPLPTTMPSDPTHSYHEHGSTTVTGSSMSMTKSTTAPTATTASAATGMSFSLFLLAIFAI
jgi:hypothetical protein